WHEIVDKHGFESEIIISFDNREEALAEAHKKPVINCRGEIFPSLTEAVNYYHMKGHTGISACLSTPPRSKSAGKYLDGTPVKWEYHIKELCP
ncbi:hypothetical protein KAR91_26735, partial [Candidatus Pacearchaeota archaeon]|nr:hypothetical protein [Candidatus Pacearchaeota archaeon]